MKTKKVFFVIFLFGILSLSATSVSAQKIANFVTYGANANPKEGDNDFKQLFFIQADKNANDTFTLELFDPDCGGKNDKAFKHSFNSTFSFTLFGGKGAFPYKKSISEFPSIQNLNRGKILKKLITSNEAGYDNKWIKFAVVKKGEGEFVNGKYYFKLLVEGISGDDANVFNIRVKSKNNNGIKILNFAPTVHLLPNMEPIQLRFNSGNSSRIIVKNYDADGAVLLLKTPYRTAAKLKSSKDAQWASNLIKLFKFENNEICAIQFGPGGKIVNDAVFSVSDQFRNAIPIILPITTAVPNNRPVIKREVINTASCNKVLVDASKSFDADKNKITGKWVLPNGIIKNGLRQKISFPKPGKYTIILAIKDNSNSVESGRYQKFNITINHPPKAIAGNDVLRAPNQKIYFNGELSYDVDGFIKLYVWNFGDGTFGEGIKTSHVYAKSGVYNVKLKITDNSTNGCNTDVDSLIVWINAAPIAIAGKDVRCAANEQIVFDGSRSSDPDGSITQYRWNFGDGQIEWKSKTLHSYKKPGKYYATLKVFDNSAVKNNTSMAKRLIWVNSSPVAKAGKNIAVAVNEIFTLDAGNSFDKDGKIIAYNWLCKGYFNKTGKLVKASFSAPGEYKIQLKVEDNSGTNSRYDVDEKIVTVNAPPVADAGNNIYQTNALVQFDAGKSFDPDGKIIKYHWDFGDEFSSNSSETEHIYKSPGEYNVILTVRDNSSVSNNTSSSKIKVIINAKPIADAGPDQIVAPAEMFKLSAKNSVDPDGKITLTEWTADNKIISKKSDFSYSFVKAGKYDIQLKVKDNSNDNDAVDYDDVIIHVNDAPVIVTKGFYIIAEGKSIRFDASKSFDNDGKISRYEWRLNGKTISNEAGFNYKFKNSGRFEINLFVTDNANVSNSTSHKSIGVFVNSSPVIKNVKNIKSGSNLVTLSAEGTFDSNGDKLGYTWNLGDGTLAYGKTIIHSYKKYGVYPVLLKVDDGHGLSNSISNRQIKVEINSAPVADAGPDEIICSGDFITFDASKSYDADGDLLKYNWDFGDGTKGEGITINKNYGIPGLYKVTLKVKDNSGLKNNVSYDTKIVRVVESPVAFAGKDITACSNKQVVFDGSKSTDSDGIVNSFSWDFGDGTTGGGERTTHVYKKAGIYKVLLTITGEQTGNCDNVDTDDLIVTVKESPKAVFAYQDSVVVNQTIKFDASKSDGKGNKIKKYTWDFGDGTFGNGKIIFHKYLHSGNYITTLEITADNKSNCNSSRVKKNVYVNESPVAVAGSNLFSNVNERIVFDASKSYDPNGRITNYKWNFGDGKNQEGVYVFHTFKKAGIYQVVLTVIDETNLPDNTSKDTITAEINSPPKGRIVLPEYGFVNKPIPINGQSIKDVDGKIKSIIWKIGNFTDSTHTSFQYVFNSEGKYDVELRLKDDRNAITLITKPITVYSIPKLIVNYPKVVCVNQTIKLKADILTDKHLYINVEWHFPNGNVKKGKTIRSKFLHPGNNIVNVMVKDSKNTSDILVNKQIDIFVNQSPIAKISVPKNTFTGGANDNILFDASKSYDADNDELTYSWDFGDGRKASGIKIYHSYLKPGNYRVKLVVSDNRNCKCSRNQVTKTIKVILR